MADPQETPDKTRKVGLARFSGAELTTMAILYGLTILCVTFLATAVIDAELARAFLKGLLTYDVPILDLGGPERTTP